MGDRPVAIPSFGGRLGHQPDRSFSQFGWIPPLEWAGGAAVVCHDSMFLQTMESPPKSVRFHLDMDTMFGQLLRRMKPGAATTWAVIVPTRSLTAVLRVPLEVRRTLGIRVFEVRDDDEVVEHFV